ncbi:hypothetical protein [Hymenobacter terrenus]|uniref:hypothetical protein n=1 Tax=Hymenobacter terrenus TaxID=1629124 RepID=UPI0006199416|nr:hypothetical protein [Hymenobacter terrenus]
MDFSLNVAFTNEQLQILYATGTNVIIAKPTQGGSPNVAWLAFKALNANTISWAEEYGIYASTSAVQNGAVLTQLSSVPVPAADNKLYSLELSGVITGPDSGGQAGSFSLLNQYANAPYMTVGLYQNANVNGTDILNNAVSAAPVLLQSTASMTPFTTVYIWLQSQVKGNSVVTNVTSPMTALKFGGKVDSISVAYDSTSGKFLPASGNKVLAEQYEVLEAAL